MTDHLTALELDEVAAGLTADARVLAHSSACLDCAVRLSKLQASRAALLGSPAAARKLEALRSASGARPSVSRWPRRRALAAATVLVPLAAMLLVFVTTRPDGGDRLKGAVSVEVLTEAGQPATAVRVGQHVALAVGGGGHSRAAVLAKTDVGRVVVAWPQGGAETAPIAPGARVRLEPGFEVTPGSVTLYAFFSDAPVDLAPLVEGLEASLARGDVEPGLELAPATARLRVEVVP
jgi:hypothetical protein